VKFPPSTPYVHIGPVEKVDAHKLSKAYAKARWTWHSKDTPTAGQILDAIGRLRDGIGQHGNIASGGIKLVAGPDSSIQVYLDNKIARYLEVLP
jgi:hypothetical protein